MSLFYTLYYNTVKVSKSNRCVYIRHLRVPSNEGSMLQIGRWVVLLDVIIPSLVPNNFRVTQIFGLITYSFINNFRPLYVRNHIPLENIQSHTTHNPSHSSSVSLPPISSHSVLGTNGVYVRSIPPISTNPFPWWCHISLLLGSSKTFILVPSTWEKGRSKSVSGRSREETIVQLPRHRTKRRYYLR